MYVDLTDNIDTVEHQLSLQNCFQDSEVCEVAIWGAEVAVLGA
jgi:hypothetical protein